jgi:hypothetical protein
MLTDAQIREYIFHIYGPDEPAPPIVDASDDALTPFPLPVPPNPNDQETWAEIINPPTPEE